MLDASPLHDTLRRWVAPFDGTIRISGDVALVEDGSRDRAGYETADGIRAAIQHNRGELWNTAIEATDYSPKTPAGVESVRVKKGDRIYFRVQSRFDGAYDQVAWNPVVEYPEGDPGAEDANGLNPHVYRAGEDFIPAGRDLSVTIPVAGTVRLSGDVEKLAQTSDDVRVLVLLNDEEVFSRISEFGQIETIPFDLSLDVNRDDDLKLRLEIDSPIDLTQIRWKPRLEYTSAEGMDSVYDHEGNPMMAFSPPYSADVYGDNDLDGPLGKWTVSESGTLTVRGELSGAAGGAVVLTVKRVNELLGKAVFDPGQTDRTIEIDAVRGDELSFEFSTRDRATAESIRSYSVSVNGSPVPAGLNFPAEEGLYGQPYRCWTYAGYNGSGDRAERPIVESDLVLPEFDADRFEQNQNITDPEELDPQYSPSEALAIVFYPEPANGRWRGYDDGTWISGEIQSSSRLMNDYVSVPKAEKYAGATAVPRLSRSNQTGFFLGGGPASGSFTTGDGKSLLDFIDMNGDRFPDVVSRNAGTIQYSPMTGGLEVKKKTVLQGEIRTSNTEAWNAGMGGTFSASMFNGKGRPNRSGVQMASLGFSANFGGSEDNQNYDLIDINGDGLPDRVNENGTVALNLGYRFAGPEYWGNVQVGKGESINGNIGASFNDGVYGFGGGVSIAQSRRTGKGAWNDINGDGLADYVRESGRVSLNTGNSFENYQGPGNFSKNVSTNQSAGLYFTISIPLCPAPPVFLIINPGVDTGLGGLAKPELALMDIDGDGFADLLKSKKDHQIEVRRNRIGRTNLLKTVKRPLGASFDIEYERDGNTYQLPHSRWNMTKVKVHDGFAGDGTDTLLTTHKYEDGFYHRREREFYGYRVVKTEQRNADDSGALYRSTEQTFMNRNYYEKGLLVSEVVRDAEERKYLETVNEYRLWDVDEQRLLADEFKATLTATVFPQLVKTGKKFHEGQAEPGITTHQTFEYDALGNVTHFFDAADTGAADDVESFIEYHHEETDDTYCRVICKVSLHKTRVANPLRA